MIMKSIFSVACSDSSTSKSLSFSDSRSEPGSMAGWGSTASSSLSSSLILTYFRRFVTRQTFNIDLMVLRPIQREEAPCSLKIDVWTKICLNFSIKPSSTSGCFGPLVGTAKSLRGVSRQHSS